MILFYFDYAGSLELIDTLPDLFLEPTSTEQLVESFLLKETTATPDGFGSTPFLQSFD